MRTTVRATLRLAITKMIGMLLGIGSFGAHLSEAATYYVGKNGSEDYSCRQAQSPETPILRFAVGIQCLRPGDTLIVGGGTYSELVGPVMYIPSGTISE